MAGTDRGGMKNSRNNPTRTGSLLGILPGKVSAISLYTFKQETLINLETYIFSVRHGYQLSLGFFLLERGSADGVAAGFVSMVHLVLEAARLSDYLGYEP
jgi:hypothetical protein